MTTLTTSFHKENAMTFWMYVILSVCTFGLYTLYYHYSVMQSLKKHNRATKEITQLFNLYFISMPASGVLMVLSTLIPILGLFELVAMITCFATATLYVWRVGNLIKDYADKEHNVLVKANFIVLFFFPGIGLNAMFNAVEDSIAYYHPEKQALEEKEA